MTPEHHEEDGTAPHRSVENLAVSKRDLTVLLVSHEASRTGAPRVAVELLSALRSCGIRTVVVHRWGGPLEDELNSSADDHVDEPLRRVRVVLRRWRRTKGAADRLERMAAKRTIRRVRPDLVWCNTLITWRYAEGAAAMGIPVVLHSHEQSEWSSGLPRSLGAIRPGFSDANSGRITFVACSGSAATALSAEVEIETAPELLHSPVDVRSLARRAATHTVESGRPTIVGCGPAIDQKGFDVFCSAAKEADSRGIDATWTWVGRKPERMSGAPANVRLPGEVIEPAPAIGAATVFVCPSRVDSFPLVVLEAMALARPIVGSRIPGIEEQLGDAGRLVDPGDAEALLTEVLALLDDSKIRSELGSSARARCEELWDIAVFRSRVGEIVDLVMATRPASRLG